MLPKTKSVSSRIKNLYVVLMFSFQHTDYTRHRRKMHVKKTATTLTFKSDDRLKILLYSIFYLVLLILYEEVFLKSFFVSFLLPTRWTLVWLWSLFQYSLLKFFRLAYNQICNFPITPFCNLCLHILFLFPAHKWYDLRIIQFI